MRNARRRAPFRFALPESRRADRSPPNARIHALRFTLALLATIALGTGLLLLPWSANPGRTTAPVEALFTAVSAAAVTGLVVVDTADHWSRFGQAVILALMQIGGLGFAVGASLLLQMLRRGPNASLRDQLLMRDGAPALSLREAILLSGRIVRYTLVVEGIGALLLTWRFASEMPLPACCQMSPDIAHPGHPGPVAVEEPGCEVLSSPLRQSRIPSESRGGK